MVRASQSGCAVGRQLYAPPPRRMKRTATWHGALQLKELSELALDFDFETIGFELPEVDLRIQSLDPTDNADRADEFSNAIGPAVSLPGDLWQASGLLRQRPRSLGL
jgi:hypothetical protein